MLLFYRQPFLIEFFILSSTPTFDFEPQKNERAETPSLFFVLSLLWL